MKQIIYPTLIFFAGLMVSCQDVIDVKLNEQDIDLYAVQARITTIDQPEVYIYKALPVNVDEPFAGVSNAIVTISDNATPSNSVELVESSTQKGLYVVAEDRKYPGIAGREYTLTIQHEGVILSAKDKLEKVSAIDSIQVYPSPRGENRFLGVYIFGVETPGIGNCYRWEVYVNNVSISEGGDMAIAEDAMVDGKYISGLEVFNDYHDTNVPSDRRINENDTLYVKQSSLSNFAYNYYTQMLNQNGSGFIFGIPPANVKGNISASDGKPVLGLFSASDVSISKTIIVDSTIENQLAK
jgi:hypothetical protein